MFTLSRSCILCPQFTVANASPDSVEGAVVTITFPVEINDVVTPPTGILNFVESTNEVIFDLPKLDAKASLALSTKIKLDNDGLRSYGKMVITTMTELEETVAHGPSTFATFKALSA